MFGRFKKYVGWSGGHKSAGENGSLDDSSHQNPATSMGIDNCGSAVAYSSTGVTRMEETNEPIGTVNGNHISSETDETTVAITTHEEDFTMLSAPAQAHQEVHTSMVTEGSNIETEGDVNDADNAQNTEYNREENVTMETDKETKPVSSAQFVNSVDSHQNINTITGTQTVIVTNDSDITQKSDEFSKENTSVDPRRDAIEKFFHDNPGISQVQGSKGSKLPEINAPLEQMVYSATVIVNDDSNVNVDYINTKSLGQQSVATTIPGKVTDDNQMETEVAKKSNEPSPQNTNQIPTEVPQKVGHQVDNQLQRLVRNRAGGQAFKICDLNRLRRFIVLGSENNTYYSTPGQPSILTNSQQNTIDNIQCLQRLIKGNRHEEVIETITEFSVAGRIAKETPILTILAYCAEHINPEVQKAAYKKVAEICNIPTKLFKFLELVQTNMEIKRKKNPPEKQKNISDRKRKKENVQESMASLEIQENKLKHARTNDETNEPVKKKRKKKVFEFKKVNKKPKKSSGWGRMRRKAVSKFYEEKDACRLLYLMTKYKSRHNWSHKELIAFCHPKIDGEEKDAKDLVMSYALKGYDNVEKTIQNAFGPGGNQAVSKVADYIRIVEQVSKLSPVNPGDEETLLKILKQYGIRESNEEYTTVDTFNDKPAVENTDGKKSSIHIVREHLHTGFLNSKKVWEALLVDMPMTALIRSMNKMSSIGVFDDPKNVDIAVKSLTNVKKLRRARIHPVKILVAMKVYEQGHGEKGDLKWRVNQDIVKAMDKAYYKCFQDPDVKNNYKTGLNYMLCLDVSGSMTFHGCVGCPYLTPAVASVAMAWVTWNVEDNVEVVAFGGQLVDMKEKGFRKDMLITDAMKQARKINFGSTDCSLPMVHALKNKLEIDVFIVYTDSDTWAGRIQPVTALRNYNQEMGRSAKLIVLGMDSSGFTIADPQDPNMMDIVGFDTNVPELISEFAQGKLSGACSNNCTECNVAA